MKSCEQCGCDKKRGGRLCARCYAAQYRTTPRGYERTVAANAAYIARNPDKRRRWVHNWQESVGIRVPALQSLRRALDALDQAISEAEQRSGVRSAGERGGDSGAERRD